MRDAIERLKLERWMALAACLGFVLMAAAFRLLAPSPGPTDAVRSPSGQVAP